MQFGLNFGAARDIETMRRLLKAAFEPVPEGPMRPPMGQLTRSLISSRTPDAVSRMAYRTLRRRFPYWPEMADAGPSMLEAVISDVRFAHDKANRLDRILKWIRATRPDFDLAFLGEWSVPAALDWLQRLPGVGLKVAAATLNFSTLHRPAFVADSHVLRVLGRFGLIGPKARGESAYAVVMGANASWSAMDLIELHVWLKSLGQWFCR